MDGGVDRAPDEAPSGATPHADTPPPAGGRRSEDPSSSFGRSAGTLRALARQLLGLVDELKDAPDRALDRQSAGLPGGEPGRVRRAVAALAWPLVTVIVCSGIALLIIVYQTR